MSTHQDFLDGLRRCGYRLTPQREMILAVLCKHPGHLTADEILKQVRARYPYLNKSAVYRSLDLFTRLSLVNQTDLGGGRIEYELHQDPHHHHLLCRKCGSQTQVDARIFDSMERILRTEFDFVPDLDHFAIFGTCRKCRKAVGNTSVIRRQ